jgi:glycosyltransferase involved in cell wall biosynthesis
MADRKPLEGLDQGADPVGMAPLVTFVIPAYDAAATVGAAISSALCQTHRNVEVVVVDDGSSDGTAEVVRGYTDPRVRLVGGRVNAGLSAARNRGMREARGELIAFLDADDYLMPSHLAACLPLLDRPRTIVTANAFWMYAGGIRWRRRRNPARLPAPARQRATLLQSNWVSVMSVFPRTLLAEIGGFDEDLRSAEDWDFWLRAVFVGWTVVHQPAPLALFNRSQLTMSSARDRVHEAERRVLEKMSLRDDLTVDERRYVKLRLASDPPSALAARADAAVDRGDWSEARRNYRKAAALVPSERPLVVKAGLMTVAPTLVGPLLQHRDRSRGQWEQGQPQQR